MDNLVPQLIFALIGIVIGSLIGAVILQRAAKWVEKLEVTYGTAFGIMFLSSVVNFLLGFVVGLIVATATGDADAVRISGYCLMPIAYLIQSLIISSHLHLRFGRAALIAFAMIAIGIALGLVIWLGVFVILMVLGGRP